MQQTRFLALLLFLISCIIIVPVYAKEDNTEVPMTRLYEVSWQKIPIGIMVGEVEENRGQYTLRIAMRSLNIAKSLANYENDSAVIAHRSKEEILPSSFEIHSQLRKKKKHVKLTYDEAGIITSEDVSHPANPKKVKPIPPELKYGSIDPLTAALRVREQVKRYLANKGEGQFIIPVYEGKHLFMVYFSLKEQSLKVGGRDIPVIHLHFFRKPLAGFSERELKEIAEGDDLVMEVYLTRDAALLPIQAEASTPLGKVKAVLKQECANWNECMKAGNRQ